MLKQHPMRSVLLLPATLLVGCLGYRTPLLEPNEAKPSGSPPRKDAATDLAPKDGRPDLASDTQGNDARSSCPAGTPYILVLGLTLGVEENLYRFDPSSLALARLGPVSCPATTLNGDSSLNSMTVSPIGPAYLSNHAGNLCLVDLTTLRVRSTLFDPASTSYNAFGMALIPDKSPAGQSLYISVQSPLNRLTGLPGGPDTLERVDLGTYAAKVIGTVRPVGDYEQDLPSAELTAGPNGELYGFAVGPAS